MVTPIGAIDAPSSREQRFPRDVEGGDFVQLRARIEPAAAQTAAAPAIAAGATAGIAPPVDLFTKIDTDQNGALSEAELEAARPRQPSPGARLSGDLMVALFRDQESQAAASPMSDRARQWLERIQRTAVPSTVAATA
ncbi:hypothetical protein ACQW02_00235 [Humitalea sp. 24SJ18S-53]|uniref:hypothetical protein n=1 Tax=Humitalea sp. 24SJ18S-53 TaxID=3422307 RepID=UPI003D6696A1